MFSDSEGIVREGDILIFPKTAKSRGGGGGGELISNTTSQYGSVYDSHYSSGLSSKPRLFPHKL